MFTLRADYVLGQTTDPPALADRVTKLSRARDSAVRSATVAECFCGCGLKVRFGRRGMNKNARRTDDLAAKLRSTRSEVQHQKAAADSDPQPLLAWLGELIVEGDNYRRFWIDAVNGDHPQTAGAALEAKRQWNAWVKKSLQMTTLLSLPAETQRRIIDSW